MALSKEQENYCKIAFLNVDVITEALRTVLDYHLTEYGCTLEMLLNLHKHKLFHLYVNKKCQSNSCKHPIPDKRVLSKHQLSKLFNTVAATSPFKDFGSFTHCLVNKSLRTADLDVSMLRAILSLCCIDFFWKSCLAKEGKSLEDFLNQHKHDLYHLWQSKITCCKCNQYYKTPSDFSVLKKMQFEMLFSDKVVSSCKPGSTCILCSCSVSPTLTESDIEDQIAIVLQDYFCPLKKIVNKLVDYRNNCYAHVNEAKFSETIFNEIWTTVTTNIEQLSIHIKCKDALKLKITEVESLLLNMEEYGKYKQLVQKHIDEDKEIIETVTMESLKITDRLDEMEGNLMCAIQKDRMNKSIEDPRMEKSEFVKCEPCNAQFKHSQAEYGCPNCKEVYCCECKVSHSTHKALQNHILVDIEEYKRLSQPCQTYDQICNLHNMNLMFYCTIHDSPVCVRCVQLKHNACPSPESIADIATKWTSLASDELDKEFEEVRKILQHLRKHTLANLDALNGSSEEIHKKLTSLKAGFQLEFKTCMDQIENMTKCSVTDKMHECKLKLTMSLDEIDYGNETFKKLQQQWTLQKSSSTDEKSFFAIREIKELLRNVESNVQYLIDKYRNTNIEFIPDESFHEAIDTLHPFFGQINEICEPSITISKLSLSKTKMQQAQKHVPIKSRAETLEIEFVKEFIISPKKSKDSMLNCTIMSERYLVVADENNQHIIIFNIENRSSSYIHAKHKPFDVAAMGDDIVVSYGEQNYIEITRLSSNHSQKRDLGNSCLGLSIFDRTIYVITYPKGITVLNDQGDILREILVDVQGVFFLSVHSERIIYSSWKLGQGNLFCTNKIGQKIWHLELRSPHGVSCDKYGNIFVAENESNEVLLVTSDGKNVRKILTAADGIVSPTSLFCHKDRSQLYVGVERKNDNSVLVFNMK